MGPTDPDSSKWRRILDLARGHINAQRPDDALELLRALRKDVDVPDEGPLAAECRILLAEAYGAKGDPAADVFFPEALELVDRLENKRPDLELRANEHFGDYLFSFAGRRSQAQDYYKEAKQAAVLQRLNEDSARIQLKLIHTALWTDDDGLDNFSTFKRAASRGHFTYEVKLAAWLQFAENGSASQSGLRYARKKAVVPEEYFSHLLESVRDSFI